MDNERENESKETSVSKATEGSKNANEDPCIVKLSSDQTVSVKVATNKNYKKDSTKQVKKCEKFNSKGSKNNKTYIISKSENVQKHDDPDIRDGVNIKMKYIKKKGTSAINGFHYKSNIISLVLYRSLNDTEIENFILGCSVGGIGSMSDICYRFCKNGKLVVVFIQTKYTGHITDDDLSNVKSDFNLFKCYQSYRLIKERLKEEQNDALFAGNFTDVVPYLVIHSPYSSKIKNHYAVSDSDKIFTDKVDSIINTGEINSFKIKGEKFICDMTDDNIENIGKTIAAYLTSNKHDLKKNHGEMKHIFIKYHHFLIPDIIKINELTENCYGEFNKPLFKMGNKYHVRLREVLLNEIFKKSKVNEHEASENMKSLVIHNSDCNAELISTLIGKVLTFDETRNKLAFMPWVPDHLKAYNLDKIEVTKSIVDEAFIIAAEKILKSFKIELIKNKPFKIKSETLVNDLIYERIEIIGKTVAAYVTAGIKDLEEFEDVLTKYHNFLIPNVIKINEMDESCYVEFNESLLKSTDKYHIRLKDVLFKEILNKSKFNEDEVSENIKSLVQQNTVCNADLISTLIGKVLSFDETSNKLAFMPWVPDHIKTHKLDEILLKKTIVDEAFVIAGEKAIKAIKIETKNNKIKKILELQKYVYKQKNIENVFENEKNMAEQFLNSLYLYTEQGKEDNVRKQLIEDIGENQVFVKNTVFKSKPEAVYDSFHEKVLKWWALRKEPYYLTKSCKFLEDTTSVVDNLSLLNFRCVTNLQGYALRYKTDAFSSFSKIETLKRINIISNYVLLTSIKLVQYYLHKNCLFIDFAHVSNMKNTEFKIILQELNSAEIETLVIINEIENKSLDKLKEIIDGFSNKIVILSKIKLTEFETIHDNNNGFENIDNTNEVLKYKITVQGKEVEIENIIEENTKNLINAGIICKIIKREKIEIGKSLSNPFYTDLSDCFVERKVSKTEFDNTHSFNNYWETELQLSTLKDIDDKVVVITAEPGMGKSALLTHLSVNNKCSYPKTWIVRMNLLDYCDDFTNWQKENTLEESMNLVCKAELNNDRLNKFFSLKVGPHGALVLIIEKELDEIASMHLNMVIYCFNEGNVIFLFDGFDEICPFYEKEAVMFMKNLVNINNNFSEHFGALTANSDSTDNILRKTNPVWITSRPYNAIKRSLVKEFGAEIFYLKRLSKKELTLFYNKYWEPRLKVEELSPEQFNNVESFFEHMISYRCYVNSMFNNNRLTPSSVPLRLMYEAAVVFFRGKILSTSLFIDKKVSAFFKARDEDMNSTCLEKHLSARSPNKLLSNYIIHTVDECYTMDEKYDEGLQLAGIPLHMHIYADFFVGEIKDISFKKNWESGVHTFEFYNRFLEMKLKIRLKEKDGEEVCMSSAISEYEQEMANVTEEHKKLAFYAFFHDTSKHFKKVLPKKEWQKIKKLIKEITGAFEKTGLIDRIHKGVPRFVHLVFAEYFAVEYIADMLKRKDMTENQTNRLIDFVINCLLKSSVGIMTVFNYKLKNDEKLREALIEDCRTRRCIFNIWMEQHGKKEIYIVYYGEEEREMEPSLMKVLENSLKYIATVLLRSIEGNLHSANIETFVDFIGLDFFVLALQFDDLIHYVLDTIRSIDASKISKILSMCDLRLDDHPQGNNEILYHLRDRYYNFE